LSIAKVRASLAPVDKEEIANRLTMFRQSVGDLIQATDPRGGGTSPSPEILLSEIKDEHTKLKELLVCSAQDEHLSLGTMVERLDLVRDLYRIAVQSESASRRLVSIHETESNLV
jgi:hypothetical protein